MKLALSRVLALAVVAAPSLAYAQAEPEAPAPSASAAPAPAPPLGAPPAAPEAKASPPTAGPRYDYFRFGAGARVGYIDDPGFDTFASNDVLAQMSLDATYAFYTKGKLAIASGLAWDVGSRASGARGLKTRITVNRVTVPIEARWYFAPWLNGFAKVAPGAAALATRIEDPSSPEALSHTPWVFATDLSGGATLRLVGGADHEARRVRLWLTTELGYGFTTGSSLRPAPERNEEDVLGSDQSTRLGSLALNGVFWRIGLALSF
jgi:hypothetical protein